MCYLLRVDISEISTFAVWGIGFQSTLMNKAMIIANRPIISKRGKVKLYQIF